MTSTTETVAESKWVVFTAGRLRCGIAAELVQEIVRHPDLLPLPETPSFIKGMMTWRRKIIPVIDLSERITPSGQIAHSPEKVIVAVFGSVLVGVAAETVSGVVCVGADRIRDGGVGSTDLEADFCRGVIDLDGEEILLLHLEGLLTSMERGILPRCVEFAAAL